VSHRKAATDFSTALVGLSIRLTWLALTAVSTVLFAVPVAYRAPGLFAAALVVVGLNTRDRYVFTLLVAGAVALLSAHALRAVVGS